MRPLHVYFIHFLHVKLKIWSHVCFLAISDFSLSLSGSFCFLLPFVFRVRRTFSSAALIIRQCIGFYCRICTFSFVVWLRNSFTIFFFRLDRWIQVIFNIYFIFVYGVCSLTSQCFCFYNDSDYIWVGDMHRENAKKFIFLHLIFTQWPCETRRCQRKLIEIDVFICLYLRCFYNQVHHIKIIIHLHWHLQIHIQSIRWHSNSLRWLATWFHLEF